MGKGFFPLWKIWVCVSDISRRAGSSWVRFPQLCHLQTPICNLFMTRLRRANSQCWVRGITRREWHTSCPEFLGVFMVCFSVWLWRFPEKTEACPGPSLDQPPLFIFWSPRIPNLLCLLVTQRFLKSFFLLLFITQVSHACLVYLSTII